MNGPLAISIAEIEAYLRMIEEDSIDERMRFLRFVQLQDTKYLEHAAKKSGSKP